MNSNVSVNSHPGAFPLEQLLTLLYIYLDKDDNVVTPDKFDGKDKSKGLLDMK